MKPLGSARAKHDLVCALAICLKRCGGMAFDVVPGGPKLPAGAVGRAKPTSATRVHVWTSGAAGAAVYTAVLMPKENA